MPPKNQQAPSSKTIKKEKERIIEDKTFGLKNKNKSKKVQEYIQKVEKHVQNANLGGKPASTVPAVQAQRKQKEEEQKAQLLALLKATLKQPTVPPGGDPKDYLCVFFANGCCAKGEGCKFSHNLTQKKVDPALARAAEDPAEKLDDEAKRAATEQLISESIGALNVYRDIREQLLEFRAKQAAQKSDRPYEEILADYRQREAARTAAKNKSDKVCNFFMAACRRKDIGWTFTCPNEEAQGYCQYRHCLPEGFVFKDEKKQEYDRDLDYEEVEDEIERKRSLIASGTPVNKETFAAWKEARLEKRRLEEERERAAVEAMLAQGKAGAVEKISGISGRALFEANPDFLAVGASAETDAADDGADDWLKDREDLRMVEGEYDDGDDDDDTGNGADNGADGGYGATGDANGGADTSGAHNGLLNNAGDHHVEAE